MLLLIPYQASCVAEPDEALGSSARAWNAELQLAASYILGLKNDPAPVDDADMQSFLELRRQAQAAAPDLQRHIGGSRQSARGRARCAQRPRSLSQQVILPCNGCGSGCCQIFSGNETSQRSEEDLRRHDLSFGNQHSYLICNEHSLRMGFRQSSSRAICHKLILDRARGIVWPAGISHQTNLPLPHLAVALRRSPQLPLISHPTLHSLLLSSAIVGPFPKMSSP